MAGAREGRDPQLVTNGVTRSAWRRLVRASNWHRYYQGALVGGDLLAAILGSVIAVNLTPTPHSGFSTDDQLNFFNLTVWLLLPAAWVLTLWGTGSYDRRYFGMGNEEFKRVIRASMFMLALVSFMALTLKADVSRAAVAVILLAAAIFVCASRGAARYILHRARAAGRGVQRVLLIGAYPEALEVYRTVRRAPAAGLVPVGIYVTEGASSVRNLDTPVPVFAGTDVVTCAEQLEADTLAVCGSASADAADLRRLAWQLEGTGRDLVVAPQLTDIAGPRVHIRPVEGLPLLHVEEPKISGVGWLIKNILDISSSVFGLILLSPLFLAVAIAIKVDSPGPVFFRQNRVGRDGETFSCWKFRTMYIDAEERQAALMMHNETDGLLFKMKDDPRITKVGTWLRRTSIDEFPQLVNVVRGEMSLVGPRPLPAENGDFLGDVRRRLLVRPGITGLWQVSGRSDLSWDDAVRLDLYYVDNWSLTTDLQILFRTVAVVLRRKGAY
ncbi:sugar transferase [Glycomyces paridis]|uniref:Sugar transferase n=1 Tax=Glycomyces paridis TaxID=2126555 RepID=A0A4S8PFA2_9ACTN|nr:sugar transferase [Glycomyces paridis]THV27992.1 sugar transferase [Glycomyces paridis]